jgi:hypothetical protein
MLNQTTWTGKVSSSWTEITNWTNGIPSFGIHAHIPKKSELARYPLISKNLKINFTLKNDGEIHIAAELFIQQIGILQNYGIVKNCKNGTVVNEGNIMNFSEWINIGHCKNKRIFTNNHRFFNEGTLDNNNTFINLGSLVNTGEINNSKTINNSGRWENFNIVNSHPDAQITEEEFFPENFTADMIGISTKNESAKPGNNLYIEK